jgi:hypothetical protein
MMNDDLMSDVVKGTLLGGVVGLIFFWPAILVLFT